MRATIAVVADDLTGAADAGAGFRRAGLATIVTWLDDHLDLTLMDDTDVMAIDAGTRVMDAAGARAITADVVARLRHGGIETLYKKIDSTLRGHVGAEVSAALGAWQADAIAIVAPAFPETGRTTIGGRQFLNGVRVEQPSVGSALQAAGIRSEHVDLTSVRDGTAAAAIRDSGGRRVNALVCDAETDDDLEAVVRAGVQSGRTIVWIGALATRLGHGLGGESRPRPERGAGPILIAVGSASEVARRQAAHVVASGASSVVIPLSALDGTDARAGVHLAVEIERVLRGGHDLVITLGETIARASDDARLAAALGELLKGSAALAGGLIATGGETATAILRAWGVIGLRLLDEVEPGVPLSVSLGPRHIPVVTKAGSFGTAPTLTRARVRIGQ
jgi:D-threonate/D-erythronate kinase